MIHFRSNTTCIGSTIRESRLRWLEHIPYGRLPQQLTHTSYVLGHIKSKLGQLSKLGLD